MKNFKFLCVAFVMVLTLATFAGKTSAAGFQEYPIGDDQEVEGQHFKVALVYFQPITMEPSGMTLAADKADIHLEADIHATEGNNTGFGVGEWMPYLTVHYTLTKQGSGEKIEGTMMPMNATDGPHYGANVKMLGAGTYNVDVSLESPLRQNYGVHTDKETGVEGRFWDKPAKLHWTFNYIPRHW
ncbi:MAG: Ferrous iron transport protein [Firmicutes bacterium]|nr:Ferrous iron transport protein [Bacillota bacterium]